MCKRGCAEQNFIALTRSLTNVAHRAPMQLDLHGNSILIGERRESEAVASRRLLQSYPL